MDCVSIMVNRGLERCFGSMGRLAAGSHGECTGRVLLGVLPVFVCLAFALGVLQLEFESRSSYLWVSCQAEIDSKHGEPIGKQRVGEFRWLFTLNRIGARGPLTPALMAGCILTRCLAQCVLR